ncbi:MAG: hypothetical protein LBE86_07035 [Gemmobacter sp.]|nr:hypothetical protein [Gemmobacter sp.]
MNPSRAFRRGFADGFTAPFLLIVGRRAPFTYSRVASDMVAWREVGSLVNQSCRQVGDLVPQGSRAAIVARVTTLMVSEQFSGPIAHPRHLREYEEICPGSADP